MTGRRTVSSGAAQPSCPGPEAFTKFGPDPGSREQNRGPLAGASGRDAVAGAMRRRLRARQRRGSLRSRPRPGSTYSSSTPPYSAELLTRAASSAVIHLTPRQERPSTAQLRWQNPQMAQPRWQLLRFVGRGYFVSDHDRRFCHPVAMVNLSVTPMHHPMSMDSPAVPAGGGLAVGRCRNAEQGL